MSTRTLPADVYSPREIARAAGAATADAYALLASGVIGTVDGKFVDSRDAVRAVRLLRGQYPVEAQSRQLFRPLVGARRQPGPSLAASGGIHALLVVILILLTMGAGPTESEQRPSVPARLVFLVQPGPGGGGGGGGLRQKPPAQRAMLKSARALRSPVPVERAVRKPKPDPPPPPRPLPPPPPVPAERPAEPPPPVAKPDPIPPVVAPVVSASADPKEQAGVLSDTSANTKSQGSGTGGGAGTGTGTGIGEGSGPGIGPGSGGGTGGGPYRPGSGITAPTIVHEVKPDYTEEARRRSLSGEVVLDIVVKSDGRVGSVRVVQGLGAGLDQRAVEAVRQWRFAPARRYGTPVDVMVEVAVEFRLR